MDIPRASLDIAMLILNEANGKFEHFHQINPFFRYLPTYVSHDSATPAGEGVGLLEKGLGCTLPESQQEGGLSVGAGGPQGASRWRDYPRRSVRARSFAP